MPAVSVQAAEWLCAGLVVWLFGCLVDWEPPLEDGCTVPKARVEAVA